ncbi:MAG: hypothetical protein IT211_01835 [Armatimonadetes bacterium]|nr:hypothetical protein [Armatimonadota bacterium]
MKKPIRYILNAISIFLGVMICFGHGISPESGNIVRVQGAYHSSKNNEPDLVKESKFNFIAEIGPAIITTSSGIQKSITIEPRPIPHKRNSDFFYWYSNSFQLDIDDTLTMELNISGDYYAKNLKSPNTLNGSTLSVVASLVDDSEGQEDSPLSFALFPPSLSTLYPLGKFHLDFKNQDSIIFNERKNILIYVKSNSNFLGKKVKIKLRILATGMSTANLTINDAAFNSGIIEKANSIE